MQSNHEENSQTFDFDALLRANVARVFNERDPQKRLAAMAELWSADAVLYEREAAFSGAQAISANLTALHARLPAGTLFIPTESAIGHHDGAILRWRADAPGHDAHTTGTDVAFIKDGRIDRLYVFLDGHR